MKKEALHTYNGIVFVFLILAAIFFLLFNNIEFRYEILKPFSKNSVLKLQGRDNSSIVPLALLDRGEFYGSTRYLAIDVAADQIQQKTTYSFVVSYPNLMLYDVRLKRYEYAAYRLQSHYDDDPHIVSTGLLASFSKYDLWNKNKKGVLIPNTNLLSSNLEQPTFTISIGKCFYHRTYHPMLLGKSDQIQMVLFSQNIVYGVMCTVSFLLFIFSLSLLYRGKDHIFRSFGCLCLFFLVHCLCSIVQQIPLAVPFLWYHVADVSYLHMLWMLMCLCAMVAREFEKDYFQKYIQPLAAWIAMFCALIPIVDIRIFPHVIGIYKQIQVIYMIFVSSYLFYCMVRALYLRVNSAFFIAMSGSIFAIVQVLDIQKHIYKLIHTSWRTEYTVFVMILIFIGYIMKRNRIAFDENEKSNNSLEKIVKERTNELSNLLEERKRFFFDVTHDLKAPVTAIQNYIGLLKQNDKCIDQEMIAYLDSIERKNIDLQNRISRLNEIMHIDSIHAEFEQLEVNAFVREFLSNNHPESDVLGVRFEIECISTPCIIWAQKEKMNILFENLFYNAMSFTKNGDTIKIKIIQEGYSVVITFADTGKGISKEDIVYIFDRLFSTRLQQGNYSGLGLYIVKMIVHEIQGDIKVASTLGLGTTFTITFPIMSHL